ncbi:MAG: hypothetical protein H0W21_11265 [Actinobacteria bacterium]|nr:hypothetical protein [Actinomycetota bacterium]
MAAAIADNDPEDAYSLVYDAARKAVDAHMLANGYRTSKSKLHRKEGISPFEIALWRVSPIPALTSSWPTAASLPWSCSIQTALRGGT